MATTPATVNPGAYGVSFQDLVLLVRAEILRIGGLGIDEAIASELTARNAAIQAAVAGEVVDRDAAITGAVASEANARAADVGMLTQSLIDHAALEQSDRTSAIAAEAAARSNADALLQPASEKGLPDGYASLDGSGKVPATQLPVSFSGVVDADGMLEIILASNWGIDATGEPYFDSAGADPAEAAWPSIDTDGVFTLTQLAGGIA